MRSVGRVDREVLIVQLIRLQVQAVFRVGTAELLGPQTAGIDERPPGAPHRLVARSHQLMAMFENSIRISAHRLQRSVALMRIWLLVDVEERVLMPIERVRD